MNKCSASSAAQTPRMPMRSENFGKRLAARRVDAIRQVVTMTGPRSSGMEPTTTGPANATKAGRLQCPVLAGASLA